MTYAIQPSDRPAPTIRYKMAVPTNVRSDAQHMANEVCTLLNEVVSDSAYLVVETPRLDVSLADLTALLAPTVQPHGGVEIPYMFGSRACLMAPQSGSSLQVVVTGPCEEMYDKMHVQLVKTLNRALVYIRQIWAERQFGQIFTGSFHRSS